MNPHVISALRDAIEGFADAIADGRMEKAEDYAIISFGLAAMFPSLPEAARAGLDGERADA
jgi:hypothetical protein